MRNYNKSIFGLVGVLIMSIAFGGCSSSTSGSDTNKVSKESAFKGSSNTDSGGNKEPASTKTIVYGGSSWMGHIPAYIAVQKGFFKEQGLNVEFKSFPTSSARMTALAAGAVDFGSTGAISAISLMASGDKSFTLFGAPDVYTGQEGIVASKDINNLEDLKGKKVAVPFSSSSHVMLVDLLKQKGLDPQKDVKIINMSGDDILSSFTNGQIDAAAIWSPAFQKIQTVQGAHVIAKDTDTTIYKNYNFNTGPDVLVISNKFVKENPDTTKKLLTGYFNAIKWMRDNPGEAATIFVKLSNIDAKEQEQIIKSIKWLDEKEQKELLGENGNLTKTMSFLSQFLSDNKLINSQVDVKGWISTDVLPQ
jgi:taurine transport system substrate-binding protein